MNIQSSPSRPCSSRGHAHSATGTRLLSHSVKRTGSGFSYTSRLPDYCLGFGRGETAAVVQFFFLRR